MVYCITLHNMYMPWNGLVPEVCTATLHGMQQSLPWTSNDDLNMLFSMVIVGGVYCPSLKQSY